MMSDEPKRTVLALVCVCILVAVAFFAAYAGQIYSHAVSAPHIAIKNQQQADQDAYYQLSRSADEHVVAVGVATIIVGFVQAIALFVTFLIIAFVAVRQLRAYVYPGQILMNFFNFTEPMIVTIDIRNSGVTPAKNVEIHGSVFLDNFPLDDNFSVHNPVEPSGGRHSRLPLYPGEPNTTSFISTFVFDPQVVNDLTVPQPKRAIYIFGEANYVDIFGIKRRTQFCRFMQHGDIIRLIECTRRGITIDPVASWSAAHVMNSFS